jgi:hypothetical protein
MKRKEMKMGEFSVYQFFADEQYERYREFVDIEEAVRAFKFLTTNVASGMGLTRRVIITDGGDCVVAEWKFKEGVVWPKQERIMK